MWFVLQKAKLVTQDHFKKKKKKKKKSKLKGSIIRTVHKLGSKTTQESEYMKMHLNNYDYTYSLLYFAPNHLLTNLLFIKGRYMQSKEQNCFLSPPTPS